MLSETAKVIQRSDNTLHLQTSRKATCSGCSMKSGCGQFLLSRDSDLLKLHTCAFDNPESADLRDGDEVTVSLQGTQVIKLSALFYILPLSTLLLATLIASLLEFSEGLVSICALTGLVAGILTTRALLRNNEVEFQLRPLVSKMAASIQEKTL